MIGIVGKTQLHALFADCVLEANEMVQSFLCFPTISDAPVSRINVSLVSVVWECQCSGNHAVLKLLKSILEST